MASIICIGCASVLVCVYLCFQEFWGWEARRFLSVGPNFVLHKTESYISRSGRCCHIAGRLELWYLLISVVLSVLGIKHGR